MAAAAGALPVGDEQARCERRRARRRGGPHAREQVVVGRAGLGDSLGSRVAASVHFFFFFLFFFFFFFLAASIVPRHSGVPQRHANSFFDLLGLLAVEDQAVVVVELLARLDVAQRLDEDAAVVGLVGLAVRAAGVVDPLRGVAAVVAVDDVLVVDVEEERVVRARRGCAAAASAPASR